MPPARGQLPWGAGGTLATHTGAGSRRGGRRGAEGRELRDAASGDVHPQERVIGILRDIISRRSPR